jgi:AmmeMemoRadiSam system protein B
MQIMNKIQMPSVAGTFYPSDPEQLNTEISALLREASASGHASPKALIAPHAGYVYSGPVAASAYVRLLPQAKTIKRVLVLAPSHRLPFRGLATSSADAFNTPLGNVAVDREAVDQALTMPQVRTYDQAFAGEHALEVQLPFLQMVLEDFRLVPFIVGDANAEEIARVLDLLWGGAETLIVISSDLSHFLDYSSARQKDQATTRAIEMLAPEQIDYHDACGRTPLSGLLLAAREHGLQSHTVDLRNSGDTAGDKNRVVGYGAYVFN